MIHLILIRHGETIENAQNICQGQSHGTLSENGIEQARLVAERLKETPIDVFYCSDLQRTIDTANEILNYHPGVNLNPNPVLRERYLADWEGKAFPANWHWEYLPEGAETSDDMIARARMFLKQLVENQDEKHVLAMTHGGFLRAFWTVIAGKTAADYFSWETPRNTSISEFTLHKNGNCNIIQLNNTDHLNQHPLENGSPE